MSEKHDQEYFSDGLSEELIDHLAHIPDLKVIARTSSFAFKGKNEDMRTIATKLGVANLLEGSVRKSGNTLRITVQLIRASDGVHLWSETYDRKLTDIFKVQDEISTTVAKALNVALNASNAAGAQSASKGTTNIEAYNLFLQANFIFARSGTGDLGRAVERFQQALILEPNYAMAWARLAQVYGWQGSQGELDAAEAEKKGRDAAQRALAIDPNCAEAYYARGDIFRLVAGNWSAAQADYEKAVALDPHSVAGEYSQGYIFDLRGAMSGRFDEYIDWAHRQMERNPLDTDVVFFLGLSQQSPGHLDESVATFRRLLELNPDYAYAWAQYGMSLLYLGRTVEALAMTEKESDRAAKLAVTTLIYWSMDRRADSDSALAELERGYAASSQYLIAAAHAYRDEKDAAFTWLDRAYQQRRGNLEYLKSDLALNKLHGDPRFKALLRKINLPE
jgi:TolB-like protein